MSTHHTHPTKPHHFITPKTRIMFIFFAVVLLIAIGSYFYLLSKTSHLKMIAKHMQPNPQLTKTPQRPPMQNPKEFTDENISLFYPDTLAINDTDSGTITWNSVVDKTIITEKAMQLSRQFTPFKQPTNLDYNNDKYFSVDDVQEREIHGINIVEYTINCGPGCGYRLDQFKAGSINYQLSFMIAGPGLSPRAEQILASLTLISPTPIISSGLKACTLEAKLCPDGSSVGRQGPNCQFAVCPGQ